MAAVVTPQCVPGELTRVRQVMKDGCDMADKKKAMLRHIRSRFGEQMRVVLVDDNANNVATARKWFDGGVEVRAEVEIQGALQTALCSQNWTLILDAVCW